MKALSLIAIVFAAFLIFLGISSREKSGALSNAVIIGGALIAVLVAIIWAITFIKEKKGK
jgi:4-amino-4-deoxy-L-arabinose transferase-like glycosyltransferase